MAIQVSLHRVMKLDQFKKKTKKHLVTVRVDEELYKKLLKLDINISEAVRTFLEKLTKGQS
jgi:post-segregation antitoxin (ccd killing protein)